MSAESTASERNAEQVARRILGPESAIRPAYVWLPLTLRHPQGRVLLAGIISATCATIIARNGETAPADHSLARTR